MGIWRSFNRIHCYYKHLFFSIFSLSFLVVTKIGVKTEWNNFGQQWHSRWDDCKVNWQKSCRNFKEEQVRADIDNADPLMARLMFRKLYTSKPRHNTSKFLNAPLIPNVTYLSKCQHFEEYYVTYILRSLGKSRYLPIKLKISTFRENPHFFGIILNKSFFCSYLCKYQHSAEEHFFEIILRRSFLSIAA